MQYYQGCIKEEVCLFFYIPLIVLHVKLYIVITFYREQNNMEAKTSLLEHGGGDGVPSAPRPPGPGANQLPSYTLGMSFNL